MFKRTNKAWKALALVLALCMLSSTVALADGDATVSTATLSDVTATYAEATQTATVTGKIDAKGNDVTILAVRGAAAATETDLAGWTAEQLQGMVTYIDQDTSAEADGSFSFSFIPGRGTGGIVTVFVGGEDVDDIEVKTFTAKMPAPGLVAQEKWYEGDNTVEFTLKKADLSAEYNGDLDAWWTAVNAVNVKIGDAAAVDMKATGKATYASGVLTIDVTEVTGVEIKEITITTTANAYYDATWNTGVKQVKKTPGTLTAPTAAVVAGTNAEITVANADDTWATALANSVYVGGTKVEGVTYAENKLSVPMTIASDKLTDSVVVTVTQDYYTDATATVNVVAPTKADADDTTIPATSYGSEFYALVNGETEYPADATLKNQKYGHVLLDLSALTSGTNGSTITWTVVEKGTENAITPADGVYDLTRSETSEKVYTVTGTVEKTGYATATVSKDITVGQIGIAGVTVEMTTTFLGADAAETATVRLDSVDFTYVDGQKFKAENVVPGPYTLTVARAGYTTLEMSVTVGNDGVIAETIPEMFAGDIDDDGKVNINDYSPLAAAWGKTLDAEGKKSDIDGDGNVNINDYSPLVANWGKTASYYVAD